MRLKCSLRGLKELTKLAARVLHFIIECKKNLHLSWGDSNSISFISLKMDFSRPMIHWPAEFPIVLILAHVEGGKWVYACQDLFWQLIGIAFGLLYWPGSTCKDLGVKLNWQVLWHFHVSVLSKKLFGVVDVLEHCFQFGSVSCSFILFELFYHLSLLLVLNVFKETLGQLLFVDLLK